MSKAFLLLSLGVVFGCAPKTTISTPWGDYESEKDVGLILEFKLDPATGQPIEVYIEATGLASPVTRAQAEAWAALTQFIQAASTQIP